MSSNITTEIDNGILRVGLNRPEKKNALSVEMYEAMVAALKQGESDAAVKVVLFHGTENCFTAGNDLKDFMNAPPADDSSHVVQFLHGILRYKKPLVAAVAGPAVGIGTTMLLHCDLVYAADNAAFQLPFVNLGLCPEAASSFLLPRLAGHLRASEILLLGEPFSAQQAYEIGLVNRVCPADKLMETALGQAHKLATQPPAAVALTKSLIKQAGAKLAAEVMAEELGHFGQRLRSPEAKEAFTAFFERRKPDFSKF